MVTASPGSTAGPRRQRSCLSLNRSQSFSLIRTPLHEAPPLAGRRLLESESESELLPRRRCAGASALGNPHRWLRASADPSPAHWAQASPASSTLLGYKQGHIGATSPAETPFSNLLMQLPIPLGSPCRVSGYNCDFQEEIGKDHRRRGCSSRGAASRAWRTMSPNWLWPMALSASRNSSQSVPSSSATDTQKARAAALPGSCV